MGPHVGLVVVLASPWLAHSCSAQWTVVNLTPPDADYAVAYAANAVGQVGVVMRNGVYEAVTWAGTAASCRSLNPAGAAYSVATGVHGGQQGGFAHIGGQWHPGLWTGSAASWVDLLPPVGSDGYVLRRVWASSRSVSSPPRTLRRNRCSRRHRRTRRG